ncbi:MAG: ATP-binding cassette domain-containing protein [Lactobacillus sp.]|jgi:peptide/nickel transport system ATP-binding protein|nr:MAG: ATP-binding cassette domain-containing protein [Lactobacillus sp.]
MTQFDKDLRESDLSLKSVVDNSQSKMSTGQTQKIKLIRALLSNPDLLIRDELINNVDAESQLNILQFLSTWVRKHTLILISHKK